MKFHSTELMLEVADRMTELGVDHEMLEDNLWGDFLYRGYVLGAACQSDGLAVAMFRPTTESRVFFQGLGEPMEDGEK